MTRFVPELFMPRSWFESITRLRVESPQAIRAEAQQRRRRRHLTRDGRLTLLAADHPARLVTAIGSDPLRMGNRWEYLARIVRILTDPTVDGLMATPDIMDDLFALQVQVREAGGPAFLDEKVLMGCMNRGGLAGSSFELDDVFTAYTARALHDQGLDGGKFMFRLDTNAAESVRTIQACAQAVSELHREGLYSFLEALPVQRTERGWSTILTPEALVPVVGVAQALGESSALTWLKLPMVPDFSRVALSTTLPILVLGGDAHGDSQRVLADVAEAMAAGAAVRGVLMGRNILFPGDLDPLNMALAVDSVVRGETPDAAAAVAGSAAGRNLDFFTRLAEEG